MRIFKSELLKLGYNKLFIVISLALLLGNLLTVLVMEKKSSTYFYVYEQKESFESYLKGDETSDLNGFYSSEMAQQQEYVSMYPVFVEEMGNRVDQMGSVSIFSKENSYPYRNLEKTEADFSDLIGTVVKVDNCFGVERYAQYNGGSLFLLIFVAVLTYYVLFQERDLNLLLLLKGTYKGHADLAEAKLSAMLFVTVLFTFLQEVGTVALFGYLYGFGDVERPIQSVSLFRNCSYILTVGEGIGLQGVIRIIVAVFWVFLLFAVGMVFRSKVTATLCATGILLLEYFGSGQLSISGSLGAFKVINPFYCWDIVNVLGTYFNLNCFGYPINKDLIFVIGITALMVMLSITGIWVFHKTLQTKKESKLEQLFQWFCKKLSFLGRNTSLLFYELYKVFIQQKKWIVAALLLAWSIYEVVDVYGPEYYTTEREAFYHYYMNQINGPVTDETYLFIEQEELSFEKQRLKIKELSSDMSGVGSLLQVQLASELSRHEEGMDQVKCQLSLLEQKEGDITEKYMVDELAYMELWLDSHRDVAFWLMGSIALLVLVCGIYTIDENRKMNWLIKSTYKGRGILNQKRDLCAILCISFVYTLTQLPLFLDYTKIDGLAWIGHKLSDFTNINASFAGTIGMLLLLVFALKLLSFIAVGLLGIYLSKRVKNEMISVCMCVGIVGVIVMLALHFGWSFNIWLLL
ncbi:MAG: hypothetical protein IJW63_10495 [Lachnospiraceae bacterium]|nr:hypothetical protein [Lachnospiraceae bacterium]